jgi:mannosyltransferase OCH1-like enzyme
MQLIYYLILIIIITIILIIYPILIKNPQILKFEKYYNENITNIINKPFSNTTLKDTVIPLNIFQTWKTKDLKPGMLDAVNMIKDTNPDFTHYLYDNDDCRAFIEKYFDKDVLTAFDCLIPGAYKADLWRYCVLYIYGGIYLDIKFIPVNGFKLINLIDKEHFCLDITNSWTNEDYGLYNAIMITKPNNIILKECIDRIVINVKNKYYGKSALEPTGPILLGQIYSKNTNDLQDIKLFQHYTYNILLFPPSIQSTLYIIYNKYPILEIYPTYREEQDHNNKNKSYNDLWHENAIYGDCKIINERFINTGDTEIYYNENIKDIINKPFPNTIPKEIVIPLNIFTHWHTKDLKPGMKDAVEKLKETNPEFEFHLYDNDDCRAFIKQYFDKDVLTAYDCLIPNSYKSDLWRYCVLYIYGGVYLDIKFIPVNGFKLINLMDREHFCLERPGHWENKYGIVTGFMITKPNNIIMKECINKIVLNVKNKYYRYNPLYPTGPGLLGEIYFNRHNLLLTDIKLVIYFSNNDTITQFIYNKYPILEMYPTYREEQDHNTNNKSYNDLWNEKAIYGNCF